MNINFDGYLEFQNRVKSNDRVSQKLTYHIIYTTQITFLRKVIAITGNDCMLSHTVQDEYDIPETTL